MILYSQNSCTLLTYKVMFHVITSEFLILNINTATKRTNIKNTAFQTQFSHFTYEKKSETATSKGITQRGVSLATDPVSFI